VLYRVGFPPALSACAHGRPVARSTTAYAPSSRPALTAKATVAPSVMVATKSSRSGTAGMGENRSASSTVSPKSCWTWGKVKSLNAIVLHASPTHPHTPQSASASPDPGETPPTRGDLAFTLTALPCSKDSTPWLRGFPLLFFSAPLAPNAGGEPPRHE